ncbi:hypothetical protein JAAARDRAFT_56178 [Jaapia argillacea MUCL 33604]|uniref:AB hydrolase-1 domain-containing protein n=1 Tax=Jaapia argillacea MUCL 33604 TaxID=933084 RepID=A0A067Q9Q6_9AGAM|nr:hypothetical protein JAAARDRAFT_56178 [Jaapia argillacea MUCL 33604]
MANEEQTLHLIYVHGFRGDQTSFQAFPTDLHNSVSKKLPSNVALQSCLYPTYKSRKPIGYVAKNFLGWLETLPPGPIILLAHSMGGLLAVDAATDKTLKQSRRVRGIIAFDVPYLGMHPHVVISGLASLFPGDDKRKSEKDMNNHAQVTMIHPDVLGDDRNQPSPMPSPGALNSRPPSYSTDPNQTPSQTTLPHSQSAPASLSSPHSPPSSSPNFLVKSVNFISKHADDPFVKFLQKHSEDPISAMQRWIVEHFQFGQCMFDPVDLLDRYRKLETWDGLWVNYWTNAPVHDRIDGDNGSEHDAEWISMTNVGEAAVKDTKAIDEETRVYISGSGTESFSMSTLNLSPSDKKSPQAEEEKLEGPLTKREFRDEQKRQRKLAKVLEEEMKKLEKVKKEKHRPHRRHFIVLPGTLHATAKHKWENVPIAGSKDEVEAHCGLFMRNMNLQYDQFVERVATTVSEWCHNLT